MPRFIPYNYKQITLIPINFEAQIQPGTFEYTVNYLVDNNLDLTIFNENI
jgi:hypothetical protein